MSTRLRTAALFLLLAALAACRTTDPRYDLPEYLQVRVDSLKRDHHYTCLEYKRPNLDKNRHPVPSRHDNHFTFNTRRFNNGQTTFALMGVSTANYGVLEKVDGAQRVRLDSTYCDHGEFLFLNARPAEKGDYEIRAWGCRYGYTLYVHLK